MTLEQRAEAVAAAVQRLRERGDDTFEDDVARVAWSTSSPSASRRPRA